MVVVGYIVIRGLSQKAIGRSTPGLVFSNGRRVYPASGTDKWERDFPSTSHVMSATFVVVKGDTLHIPNASVYL